MGSMTNTIWFFAACLLIFLQISIILQSTDTTSRTLDTLRMLARRITELKETKCNYGPEIELVVGKLKSTGYIDSYNTNGLSGRDGREQTGDGSPTIDGVDGLNGPTTDEYGTPNIEKWKDGLFTVEGVTGPIGTVADIRVPSNDLQPMSYFAKDSHLLSDNGKFKATLTRECNLQVDHELYILVHQLPFKCLYLQFTGRSIRGVDVYLNEIEPELEISDKVVFLKLFDNGKLAYVNKKSGKVEKVLIKSILK